MSVETIKWVRLTAETKSELNDSLERGGVDTGCAGDIFTENGRFCAWGLIEAGNINKLEQTAAEVQVDEQSPVKMKRHLKCVCKENRYQKGRTKKPLGIAFAPDDWDGYHTSAQIDSFIERLEEAYKPWVEVEELPHTTVDGRTCYALRVGNDVSRRQPALMFVGGLHAREWMPSEICLTLAADLLEARSEDTGIAYGGARFQKEDVDRIIDELGLIIFPNANPDGREYSQTTFPMWRGNRNVDESDESTGPYGVDLNRNFDWLWDFPRYFSSTDAKVRTSVDRSSQTFRGDSPLSESETRNVDHLFNEYPSIRWFIDIHSHVPAVFILWSSDDIQTTNSDMRFNVSGFDDKRGVKGDTGYGEYIPSADLAACCDLAHRLVEGIRKVRGTHYDIKQAFNNYIATGTSQDYAYSRHVTSQGKAAKILSFTLETGTDFHPDWTEASQVISEVPAGLIEFCLEALRQKTRARRAVGTLV